MISEIIAGTEVETHLVAHVRPMNIGGERAEDGVIRILYSCTEIAKTDCVVLEIVTIADIIHDSGEIVVSGKLETEIRPV
jgi:hypothetical protein